MIETVEKARQRDPKGYKKRRAAKLLAAVLKVAFEDIPSDPTRDVYRQGGTLGDEYKHWFRANSCSSFASFSATNNRRTPRSSSLPGLTITRRCAPMRAPTTPTPCFAKC